MPLEEVDGFGKREDGGISREHNCDGGNGDEERLDVVGHFRGCGRAGEQGEAEVDEDEILGELGESGEDVFGCALCTTRHGVVRVVLEGDTTEEEGYDTRHADTVGEEVARVCR